VRRGSRPLACAALVALSAGCGAARAHEAAHPPASGSFDARAVEAGPLLKQARALQQTYRDQYDRYAETMEELAAVGWSPVPLRYFHAPVIRPADPGHLCIEMLPAVAELWIVSITENGEPARGSCR
jgi:hypothetical protein